MIFEHSMGWNTARHDIGRYSNLFAPLTFWFSIFIIVRNEKRKLGTLSFGNGWKAGVIATLVYAVGFTLLIAIYQKLINPEYYETLKVFMLHKLETQHASQEQIDSAMKEIETSYNGSATSYLLLFVFTLVWGVLLSAIAASIYKTKKPV